MAGPFAVNLVSYVSSEKHSALCGHEASLVVVDADRGMTPSAPSLSRALKISRISKNSDVFEISGFRNVRFSKFSPERR